MLTSTAAHCPVHQSSPLEPRDLIPCDVTPRLSVPNRKLMPTVSRKKVQTTQPPYATPCQRIVGLITSSSLTEKGRSTTLAQLAQLIQLIQIAKKTLKTACITHSHGSARVF